MAPRGAALLPLLTALGTTAAVAVLAQKYIPQYMEKKHKKKSSSISANTTDATAATMPSTTTATTEAKQAPVAVPVATPSHSSTIVSILLQDSYLLVSAFGACIMVVAVLVSLALVAVREDVASLNDLQMFPPLMLVAMGLISLGMVLSMLNPKPLPELAFEEDEAETEKEKQPDQADAEAIKKAAQQGQGFLYDYYKNKYANQTEEATEEVDEDGQPKKRVSRCPFGFT